MIRQKPASAVVLLHGLAANRLVMARLAKYLKADGYQTANWGYPSTRGTIDNHARRLNGRIEKFLARGEYCSLHFVTHSMGGIVARRALSLARPVNLGRCVMLGPPNAGSHVARRLATPLGRLCRPLAELSDSPHSYVNRLREPSDLELGIIAAASDRVVKLQSTNLAAQQDHITLPGHHGMLPWRRDTAEQVIHFLRHGKFNHA